MLFLTSVFLTRGTPMLFLKSVFLARGTSMLFLTSKCLTRGTLMLFLMFAFLNLSRLSPNTNCIFSLPSINANMSLSQRPEAHMLLDQ
jgi:hypothetical protein